MLKNIGGLLLATAATAQDTGFEKLYITNNKTVSECFDVDFPAYADGVFVLPSLGQFEVGDMRFTGALDAFGKFNRFTLSGQGSRLCFATRMIDSLFYRQSLSERRITNSVLFSEPIPSRGDSGMKATEGPRDNVFVNTYRVGDKFRAVTDSPVELEFDPVDLSIVGNVSFADAMVGAMNFGTGSSHPHFDRSTGCTLGYHGESSLQHSLILYQLCPGDPYQRRVLNRFHHHYLPYFHSYGLTAKNAIFPLVHFEVSFATVMADGGLLDAAFTAKDVGQSTTIVAMPLDGTKPTTFDYDGELYYTHVVNTFEDDVSITLDLVSFSTNPFSSFGTLDQFRNKTYRDHMTGDQRGVVSRVIMDKTTRTATMQALSDSKRSTDFPRINPEYEGKPYCVYWAVQWYHDIHVYGSMAVVKHNICKDTKQYYHQPNSFPSEPTFLDDPDTSEEDVGLLILSMFHGPTATTSITVLNATTMEVLNEKDLSTSIGFTTHGQHYIM